MKTSKLIEQLKQFGEVRKTGGFVSVRDTGDYKIAVVATTAMFSLVTDGTSFSNLNSVDQSMLFDILCDYAMTPLDQREDEPRFIVHLYPGTDGFMYNPFVERDTDTNRETRFKDKGIEKLLTYFTLSEYEQIQDEADRAGFILPDYDAENTAMFVPVKDGDEK